MEEISKYTINNVAKKEIDMSTYRSRLEFYRRNGFTPKARCDRSWKVRLAAYRALGFTENARYDPSIKIRTEAEEFFKKDMHFILKILLWWKDKIFG